MKQQETAQIENAFKVLEKEGNKVSRDKALPPGKNADKGYDIPSFNAGMRYAMARLKTSLKQVEDGKYVIVDFPKQGQHALPAKGTTPAKKAVANKATKPKAPAKKTAASKVEDIEQPEAKVVDINTAKKAAKPKIKKIAKRA